MKLVKPQAKEPSSVGAGTWLGQCVVEPASGYRINMAVAFLCFLAVICSFLHEGLAITCYQCNSHNDSRCLLPKLPDVLRQPCSSKDTMCRKISQVVEFETNGMPPDSRVIRGCGWDESNYKGRCYQRSGFGGRQEVCSCTEDGCNSSSMPVAATALMLLTFALLRF